MVGAACSQRDESRTHRCRTLEQQRVGKRWTKTAPSFGETCFFKYTSGTDAERPRGGDMELKRGIYVGHHERREAFLMLTPRWLGEYNRQQQMTVGRTTRSRVLDHLQRCAVGREASTERSSRSS